jgi:hypothetical protein
MIALSVQNVHFGPSAAPAQVRHGYFLVRTCQQVYDQFRAVHP